MDTLGNFPYGWRLNDVDNLSIALHDQVRVSYTVAQEHKTDSYSIYTCIKFP